MKTLAHTRIPCMTATLLSLGVSLAAGDASAHAAAPLPQCLPQEEGAVGYSEVSVERVAEMLAAKGVHVFDANPEELFREAHVPGAKWVEHRTFERDALPADISLRLVFYCYNRRCRASHMAASRAVGFGFKDVQVMVDGITGWRRAGHPVESATRDAR